MKFIYLFDPLCGFCYASSKGIANLAKTHEVDGYATGLFANTGKMMDEQFANYAWANDMKISQMTGLPFSENYRQLLLKGGEFNSFALTVACVLLKNHKPNELLPVFSELQKLRYVDGLDTSDITVVKNGLIALGQNNIANQLNNDESKNLANDFIRQGQLLASQFGVRGVPSLIAEINGKFIQIPSQFLYQDTDNVADNIEQFLKGF
ncbi:disulfide bond formation protein DsbA [Mannheimia indoligenes]|uniref:Disulfide bond formation protein DsbA n=1 Tax=Mannheimia indoligenes TaxID=3103145 RepID=A0ABU7ZG07_9PAST